MVLDALMPHLHPGSSEAEGVHTSFKRTTLLVLAVTLHNIPEGMAIGVAFGSLAYGLDGSTAAGAWMLALGIGLQNLPEGMAVSVPLRREGYSRGQSFFYGQLSGVVEPIAAVLGALLRRSIKKGKPDLNILFQYNMPLRALSKMTNGAISMGMVDGIVMELQGFWIIGLVRVIVEAVKNLVLNSRMEERLKNS